MSSLTQIDTCGISGAKEFYSLWKLPALPLTERFGTYQPGLPLAFDQELVISLPTGHIQLRNQIDPSILYTGADYAFRTGASQKSRRDVGFFMQFFRSVVGGRHFRALVDVGGNDRFVAKELAGHADYRAVIDPICLKEDGLEIDGVRVFGRFIEQVNLSSDLPTPDLVVCRHTLEHISRPGELIRQLISQCAEDCLMFIEVPAFECMLESLRFDAIFHQHFQYFDLASLRWLVEACGGEYVAHTYNHQGSCGGALLFAFRKASRPIIPVTLDAKERIAQIRPCIERFCTMMASMAEQLQALPKPVYGYGASLMLSTLAYHLRTDLSELECVLDDDPERDGAGYENLPVLVRHPDKVRPPAQSSYLVTSLENVRPIVRRISELAPRRVLVPNII